MVKVTFDWNPAPLFDTSLEYIYKDNNYPGTTLGRLGDRRNEIFGTVSYGDFSKWRVTLMGDYEWVKYDSYHRNISDTAAIERLRPPRRRRARTTTGPRPTPTTTGSSGSASTGS
jgi:hypothetical protein